MEGTMAQGREICARARHPLLSVR